MTSSSVIDIDECSENRYCLKDHQLCVNEDGGYSCDCHDGYEMTDTGTCTDRDECLLDIDNCDINSTVCRNEAGTFSCECDSGYDNIDQTADPVSCEDVNECTRVDLTACDVNAECINTRGSYTCVCRPGFTGDDKKCDGQ
ncbi:hypothetical protein LSAT2_029469 [Lamellibrachia satsuma]|nr:hypothetical protein LSAT2_029469 [Lamellibrachia satsuma]